MLGHKSAIETLNRYRHFFDSHFDDVAVRMNEALRAAPLSLRLVDGGA